MPQGPQLSWDLVILACDRTTYSLCPLEHQATDIKPWHQHSELPMPTIPGSLNIVQRTHSVNNLTLVPRRPWQGQCWPTKQLSQLWQSGLSSTIASKRTSRSFIIAFSNTKRMLNEFLKKFPPGWFCCCCLEFKHCWKLTWESADQNCFKCYIEYGMLSQKHHSQNHRPCVIKFPVSAF